MKGKHINHTNKQTKIKQSNKQANKQESKKARKQSEALRQDVFLMRAMPCVYKSGPKKGSTKIIDLQ